MSDLAQQIGVDLSSSSQRRAVLLAENDTNLIRDLIAVRKQQHLKQKDVADRLGLSQASIAKFERYDNDPKLSTIRRYAHAVGAVIHHAVDQDRGQFDRDFSQVAGWGADAVVRMHLRPQRGPIQKDDWAESA